MLGRVKVVLSFVALLVVFTLVLSTNLSKADNNPDLLNQEAILNENMGQLEDLELESEGLQGIDPNYVPEPIPIPTMLGSRDVNIRVNVMPGAGVGVSKPYAWIGRDLTIWGNVTNGNAPYTYEWNFGDGSPVVSGTVSNPKYIYSNHSYITLGQKQATLTVTDSDGDIDVDVVVINVVPQTFEVEVHASIENGLRWLYLQQRSDGSWDYSSYDVAATAQIVLAFENQGYLPIDDYDENIYAEYVKAGLDYITSNLITVNIGTQPYCNPEEDVPNNDGDLEYPGNVDHNGIGVCSNNAYKLYDIGMIMMAMVGSGCVGTDATGLVAPNGPSGIVGRTYYDLVVDMVDYCAWAQTDGSGRGGWRYYSNSSWGSDNSVTQWPSIGLEAAETQWGISAPPCVKSELERWINYSQSDYSGCFGYSYASGGSIAMTGAGICEMAYCDIPVSDPRYQDALSCLNNMWNSYSKGNSYNMYAIAKGLRIAVNDAGEINEVPFIGTTDWYEDYATYLMGRQYADGSWPSLYYNIFDEAWAVLILEETWIACNPVAIINSPDTVAVGAFNVDGLQSYHPSSNLAINEWLWDFDISDGVDWDNPDAAGAEVLNPGYVLPENVSEKSFTMKLRIRDNASPSQYAYGEKTVIVDKGNHAPYPDCGGPYSGKIGEWIVFDGTASYDPDSTTLDDYIASYAWDLDFDGQFDDCFEPICSLTYSSAVTGYIGLAVTDKFGEVSGDSSFCYVNIVIDTVDLFLTQEDVKFSQYSEDTVMISATVHCSTTVNYDFELDNFIVRFYEGDPDVSSIIIGEGLVSGMYTNETRTISVKWEFIGEECKDVYVRVDPWSTEEGFEYGEIPEYNEWFNNEATKTKCPCGDEIIILPNPMAIPMANYIGPIVDTVELNSEIWIVDLPAFQAYMFIGGFTEEYPAEALDLSSIRINDTIVPIEITVVNDVPVFPEMEEVLFVKFKIREFILHYGWIYDFYDYKFTVAGNFNDQTPYEECGMVPIRGHISGDINNDGMSDIVDLTLMIDYIFRNVEIDNIESTGDINHDGQITITDLTEFINYLFTI